jgi:hypothetical protein
MTLSVSKEDDLKELSSLGIVLLDCDVCGARFSSSMEWAWPFCSAGIPHEKMDSKEQIRRQELLAKTPEKATASFVEPILRLYGPYHMKVSWEENGLPEYPDRQYVTLTTEKMKQFSDDYKIAGAFIGNILGKHNWCKLDLVNYAMRAWKKSAAYEAGVKSNKGASK